MTLILGSAKVQIASSVHNFADACFRQQPQRWRHRGVYGRVRARARACACVSEKIQLTRGIESGRTLGGGRHEPRARAPARTPVASRQLWPPPPLGSSSCLRAAPRRSFIRSAANRHRPFAPTRAQPAFATAAARAHRRRELFAVVAGAQRSFAPFFAATATPIDFAGAPVAVAHKDGDRQSHKKAVRARASGSSPCNSDVAATVAAAIANSRNDDGGGSNSGGDDGDGGGGHGGHGDSDGRGLGTRRALAGAI